MLPVRFLEGQKEYFGKKGMSMHIDVFFIKQNDELKKHVYFTNIYRCEQGVSSVISIADAVLDQFRQDEPEMSKLFAKSDNANCYHANFSAESMYNLCHSKGLQLLRYDFNEPCCGKDQCDRESAAAKTIIRSYVDEDIETAIKYGYGVKDGKVCVLKIENAEVTGKKIANISNYHSYQFTENEMLLWGYYNIGSGVRIAYNNITVIPSYDYISQYSSTETIKRKSGIAKKKREDRKLNTNLFCKDPSCDQTFSTLTEMEGHVEVGVHQHVKETTSFDIVRKSFVNKMKATKVDSVSTSLSTKKPVLFTTINSCNC